MSGITELRFLGVYLKACSFGENLSALLEPDIVLGIVPSKVLNKHVLNKYISIWFM